MMTCFSYSGTFTGFLSVVFDVYDRRAEEAVLLRPGEASPLFCDAHIDGTDDEQKAARVAAKINALCGSSGLRTLWKAWLSEQQGMDNVCLDVIRYAIRTGTDVLSDFGNPSVVRIRETEKMMHRESHRMEAFVRFRLGADGVYTATVEPDFNVLPMIAAHFEERYADQRWLIYDLKRRYGIYYDLHSVAEITVALNEEAGTVALDADEDQFASLWKEYFRSTNIKARRNMKLHLQHVPRRYWKLLTEKHIGI
jgi:probable DNA metabolism protein